MPPRYLLALDTVRAARRRRRMVDLDYLRYVLANDGRGALKRSHAGINIRQTRQQLQAALHHETVPVYQFAGQRMRRVSQNNHS